MKKIILASGSPRRKMLLQWAEIEFEVITSDVQEDFDPSMSPQEVAKSLAVRKNSAVFDALGALRDTVVIAADTLVVLDGMIINKPVDRSDAIAMLSRLSGATHEVITGVNIRSAELNCVFYDRTRVSFHPYDKAGAYAIQEWIGVVGIRSIEGDFYNVMGLPISRVLQEIQPFIK